MGTRKDLGSINDQDKIIEMLLPGERAGLRKGRQEGRLEMLREDIWGILEARFGNVPYSLREKIKAIPQDIRLRELHRQAVLVESLEAFAAKL